MLDNMQWLFNLQNFVAPQESYEQVVSQAAKRVAAIAEDAKAARDQAGARASCADICSCVKDAVGLGRRSLVAPAEMSSSTRDDEASAGDTPLAADEAATATAVSPSPGLAPVVEY